MECRKHEFESDVVWFEFFLSFFNENVGLKALIVIYIFQVTK